ncbi:hypothetical protein [Pontibacillus sp. HMF3514]|nr:hypothetical protein [Pontibacillus sp. HMF3514]
MADYIVNQTNKLTKAFTTMSSNVDIASKKSTEGKTSYNPLVNEM